MLRRYFLVFIALSGSLLLWQSGCTSSTTCTEKDQVGSLTVDPSNSPCNFNCDCNNQLYEGSCVSGKCVAFQREQCSSQGARRPCLPVVGNWSGTQLCKPAYLNTVRWGDCEQGNGANCEPELCDGKDNDCDGLIDEDLSRICYEKEAGCKLQGDQYTCQGECQEGVQSCVGGVWSSCRNKTYPSPEICDGKDNNCDGDIDENNPGGNQLCFDTTKEGSCQRGSTTCDGGRIICLSLVKPTKESCDNEDNDCDGQIDEELVRPCYSDEASGCRSDSKGGFICQGTCLSGTQSCRRGQWEYCSGMVLPTEDEVCGNGKDDNCNGSVDEECPCTDGTKQDCGIDKGECKKGVQTCSNSKWGTCEGQTAPKTELCDGKDNNCDGQVDENLKETCFSGTQGCTKAANGSYACLGECGTGTRTCEKAKWTACTSETLPKTELCNYKDDDCNGKIDDVTLNKTCTATGTSGKQGECAKGKLACIGGKEICQPSSPNPEICDGLDNDCDGTIDEELWQPCWPSTAKGCVGSNGNFTCTGICKEGKSTCANGKWGTCQNPTLPQKELCNDRDDDCNGQTDEGCDCTIGKKQLCGSNVGSCTQGTKTCGSDGKWGSCIGGTTPKTEICDGKDNDCDGQIDDNLYKACYTGTTGCTLSAGVYKCVGLCKSGTQSCVGGQWSPCNGQAEPRPELCNNQDDDCNGKIDDNVPLKGCLTGKAGICNPGKSVCTSGKISCISINSPQKETCNGVDDDCDGYPDNGIPIVACNTGRPGICGPGTSRCVNGTPQCIANQQPQPEKCNNLDDSCSGRIDDGPLQMCPPLQKCISGKCMP